MIEKQLRADCHRQEARRDLEAHTRVATINANLNPETGEVKRNAYAHRDDRPLSEHREAERTTQGRGAGEREAHAHRLKDLYYEDEPERTCTECGKPMTEGYCIAGGLEYYCSDECLHVHYTPEEREELYDDGNSDSYRTEREE